MTPSHLLTYALTVVCIPIVAAYEPDDLSEDCPWLEKGRTALARAKEMVG